MKIRLFLLFLSFISINAYSQVYYGSFSVGGSSASYYPVLFSVSGVDGTSSLGKLSVYIDNVHANGTWSGMFHSDIEFISSNYGHTGTKIVEFTYVTGSASGSSYNDPIGDIIDGSTQAGGSQLVMWLKGAATYQWSTTLNSRVSLMDGNSAGTTKTSLSGYTLNILTSQSQLVLNAKNNRFYQSIGLGTSGNGYFGGNVGIGTSNPQANLDINNSVRISPYAVGSTGTGYLNTGVELKLMNGNIYNSGGNSVAKISFGGMYNPSGSSPTDYIYNSISWSSGQLKIRNNQQDKIMIGGGDEWGQQNVSINPQGGNVGIGTTIPDQKLTVKGKVHAEEVIVDLNVPVADYVFKSNYKLMPLPEVEQFVKTNNHLPEIPSATEITKNGLNMGEMQNKLLQKVEELTLYMIGQQKTIDQQQAQIKELNNKLSKLDK